MFYCDSNRCVLSILGSLQAWNLLFLLFMGGIASHKSVKVTIGTQYRNALIREARAWQGFKGRRDYCTRARFTLDLIWQQWKCRVPVLPCPSVFTTFLSKAFQVMPPLCCACSLSPQLHWGDPVTELSHMELGTNNALAQGNWAHLLINRAKRSLTPHSPLPSLLHPYLCRPLSLCSCDSLANEFSSWRLEFHRNLKQFDFLCWEDLQTPSLLSFLLPCLF